MESFCLIEAEGFQNRQWSNLLSLRFLSLFLRILNGKKTVLGVLKLGYLHSWAPFDEIL